MKVDDDLIKWPQSVTERRHLLERDDWNGDGPWHRPLGRSTADAFERYR